MACQIEIGVWYSIYLGEISSRYPNDISLLQRRHSSPSAEKGERAETSEIRLEGEGTEEKTQGNRVLAEMEKDYLLPLEYRVSDSRRRLFSLRIIYISRLNYRNFFINNST